MYRGGALADALRFLEQYYSQSQLKDILGVSERYQRLIKEGKRSGAKYRDSVQSLFDELRRSTEPPKKRRRPPRKRPSLAFVYVPDLVNVLFSIFQPRTFKFPRREWEHRQTLFLTYDQAWPSGAAFNTWDGYYIVLGVADEADARFRKYRRVLLDVDEEDEDEETIEVSDDIQPDTIEFYLDQLQNLTEKERAVVSHLPLEPMLIDISNEVPEGKPVFVNFWITRVSTAAMPPDGGKREVEAVINEAIDAANDEYAEDGIRFYLVGLYGYSGWNS